MPRKDCSEIKTDAFNPLSRPLALRAIAGEIHPARGQDPLFAPRAAGFERQARADRALSGDWERHTVIRDPMCRTPFKVPYSSMKRAKYAAAVTGKKHGLKLYVYKCTDCKNWHLTRQAHA